MRKKLKLAQHMPSQGLKKHICDHHHGDASVNIGCTCARERRERSKPQDEFARQPDSKSESIRLVHNYN